MIVRSLRFYTLGARLKKPANYTGAIVIPKTPKGHRHPGPGNRFHRFFLVFLAAKNHSTHCPKQNFGPPIPLVEREKKNHEPLCQPA